VRSWTGCRRLADAVWVVFLAAFLIAAAPPSRKAFPDEADRVRIAEARRVARYLADDVWPGFAAAPSAVLLVTPEAEYLFYHTHPTGDFASLGYDSVSQTEVFRRDRVFNTHLLSTFPAVAGLPTVVIGQPRNTEASRSTRWVATLLHEHFHQYQQSRPDYYESVNSLGLAGGDTTGAWMLDYPFPYDSKAANEAFLALCRCLFDAVDGIGKPSFRERVSRYLETRSRFRDVLDAKDYAYFSFQVWQEGIARYTEYTLARRAGVAYTPTRAFAGLPDFTPFEQDASETLEHLRAALLRSSLKGARRSAFYHVGAAEGLLLDHVSPGWRGRYFTEKFFVERYFDGVGAR